MRVALASLAVVLACACAQNSTIADRALAAIMGAITADAATMPLHWIYNVNEIKNLVGNKAPEFHHPPSSPDYLYKQGESTPYGQQLKGIMESIAANGQVIPSDIQQSFYNFYTNGTCQNRLVCYWTNSTTNVVNFVDSGHKTSLYDNQADAIAHMIPAVALLAGDPTMVPQVAAMISQIQNSTEVGNISLSRYPNVHLIHDPTLRPCPWAVLLRVFSRRPL